MKVSEHFHCHQRQRLPQHTQPWSDLQDGQDAPTRYNCNDHYNQAVETKPSAYRTIPTPELNTAYR